MVLEDQIGKRYPPHRYAVGREKIREYARAIGETDPLCTDLDVAQAAGFADLLAPPMFAVLYQGTAVLAVLLDPELEVDLAMVVHGGQEFYWEGPVVVAGDEITSVFTVREISEQAGMRFYVSEARSINQRGEIVCRGMWTNIMRRTAT